MSWLHIIQETTYRCSEAVRFRRACLKSTMLVRCVLDHEIDDHTDATIIRFCHLMLDPRGHVASWNSGAQRLKGYTSKEITMDRLH